MSTKIVVFADESVGASIVDFLLRDATQYVAAVVVTDLAGGIATRVFSEHPDIPILKWDRKFREPLIEALRKIGAEIFFLAWWPYILKEELQCGQRVTLNTHPSLLPYGRGKYPNFWALARDEPFGVTIHHVVAEVDAGPIAFQREIPSSWEDTGHSLYKRAQSEIVDLFVENWASILALEIPSIPQQPGGSVYYKQDLEPASEISLDEPTTAREVLNLLRARTFRPHPGCRFNDAGKRYEIAIDIQEVETLLSPPALRRK